MNDKILNSTIEILGKSYSIRCAEDDLRALQEAARYLNGTMTEIRESGKVINLERVAIIAGLNIANELLQLKNQKKALVENVNEKITHLHSKLDKAIHKKQVELDYQLEQA